LRLLAWSKHTVANKEPAPAIPRKVASDKKFDATRAAVGEGV